MKLLNMLMYNYYMPDAYKIQSTEWDKLLLYTVMKHESYRKRVKHLDDVESNFHSPLPSNDLLLAILIEEVYKNNEVSHKLQHDLQIHRVFSSYFFNEDFYIDKIWDSLLPEQRLIADALRSKFLGYNETSVEDSDNVIEIKNGLKLISRTYEIVNVWLEEKLSNVMFDVVGYGDNYNLLITKKNQWGSICFLNGSKDTMLATANYFNKCFGVGE